MFNSEISHTYFVTRALTADEIHKLHEVNKINPKEQENPKSIFDEMLI